MFTFFTITYNHENYIIEHLESIKYQILKYGNNIACEILLCDDCSQDKTVEIMKKWLDQNDNLFNKINILQNKTNRGIVHNYINGIKNINSEKYKALAGDDIYYKNNIFEVLGKSNIVFTPAINFSKNNIEIEKSYRSHCKVIKNKNKNLFQVIQKQGNFISTPGCFLNKQLFDDEELVKTICKYKWIEDLPTWYYLFFKEKMHYSVVNIPFIMRRDETGISTNKKNVKNNIFKDERVKMFHDFGIHSKNNNKNIIIKKIIKYYKKNIEMYVNYETRKLLKTGKDEKVIAYDYLMNIKHNAKLFYSQIK